MRHIRIKHNSVPLMGTSRHRGPVVLPDKHGVVKKHIKGKGAQIQLMEPELSQHGLGNITDGMSGMGVHSRKKHIKPLHFRL